MLSYGCIDHIISFNSIKKLLQSELYCERSMQNTEGHFSQKAGRERVKNIFQNLSIADVQLHGIHDRGLDSYHLLLP